MMLFFWFIFFMNLIVSIGHFIDLYLVLIVSLIVCLPFFWQFLLKIICSFIKSGAIFYSNKWIIYSWKIEKKSIKNFTLIDKLLNIFASLKRKVWNQVLILGWWIAIILIVENLYNNPINFLVLMKWVFNMFLIIICFLLIITVLIKLLRHLYQSFHPLYAFWNLWEKIQSLTPQIEIESKDIKEELNNTLDIDYKTLHHSFDTLSHTFEKIASLVIRLEKIETRANKWNLFDSKKYIGSLKDDILTPLSSLSTFLWEKETELRAKQEELSKMRVQVWWSGESWQTTLTRARIEPLIEEIGRQRGVISSMKEKISLL